MITLLRNCKVVDVRKGKVREGSITIQDDKILSVDKRAGADRIIDLKGAYVLPGLISCHTHLSLVFPFHETKENESPAITALRCWRRGMDALNAGITTVRTVSEMHRADIDLRTMSRKGWVQAPRIYSAGKGISTTGGHGHGFGVLVADGPDEFRKAVRQEFTAGANHIKIFITGGIAQPSETFDESQMTFEEVKAAVEAAQAKNSYVCAHSGSPIPIQQAVRAGVKCFEHGYHMDSKTVRAMREAGCYLVPTLVVTRSPTWMKEHGFEDWTIKKALGAGADHLDSIKAAVREGVKIVNGTDLPPGDKEDGIAIVVKEMEYLIHAGLSNLGAIQASTIHPAELLGISRQLGAVESGLEADLIACQENPLSNIRALAQLNFVMQAGQLIRESTL